MLLFNLSHTDDTAQTRDLRCSGRRWRYLDRQQGRSEGGTPMPRELESLAVAAPPGGAVLPPTRRGHDPCHGAWLRLRDSISA